MNTQELRINNLFIDRKGQICKVERIEKEFEECKILSNTGLTHFPFEPIQLTEEILVNWCGFEKIGYNYRLKKGWHWIQVDKCSFYINGKQYGLIDYVHQLQNLYFALTGEELPINHPSAK